MDDRQRQRRCEQAVLAGLIVNIALAAIKTAVGLSEGSQALLADGVNSTSDVIYFVATLVLLRVAAKEPDHEHPHGHGQSESIATLIIGAFVVTTAVAIFYDSVSAVMAVGSTSTGGSLALWVAAGTVVIKGALIAYTLRVAASTDSKAVVAIAADHRNDLYASLTVFAGVGAALLGYPLLDPLAGAVVAGFIFYTGLGIIREAADDLMGTLPGRAFAAEIRSRVARVRGVAGIGEVRAYRFGRYYVLNVEIEVDSRLSVEQGHLIASVVEQTLVGNVAEVRKVYTHLSPSRR